MRDKGGSGTIKSRSQPGMARLNELWRMDSRPELRLVVRGPEEVAVLAGEKEILNVLPGDTEGEEIEALARRWMTRIEECLRTRR